jgi:hypothetical protein
VRTIRVVDQGGFKDEQKQLRGIMAFLTVPEWIRESWTEYKERVASSSPKFVKEMIHHKHFDKTIIVSWVMAVVYLSIILYFFL